LNTEDLIVNLVITAIAESDENVVFNQDDGLGLIIDAACLNHPGRKSEFDIVKECGIRAIKGDDYGWLITDTAMIVKVMSTMAKAYVASTGGEEQSNADQSVRPAKGQADVLHVPAPRNGGILLAGEITARSLACGEDLERPSLVDANGGAIGCQGINPEVATVDMD